jgi:diguanylate cyclase (GGDEF)-like protein
VTATSTTAEPIEQRASASERWLLPRRAVRQAAFLFLGAGIIGLINDAIPGSVGYHHLLTTSPDAINTGIGILTWIHSDNRFLRSRFGLILPLGALAIIALSNTAGALPAPTLGIWYVLVYVWVGLWFPRGTVATTSPCAFAAYVLPLLCGAPRTRYDMISVLLVIPAAVLSGEVVASVMSSLRQLHAKQQNLLGELTRASVTDSLTGIGNRRLGEMLLETLSAADAVILLDLDHFKSINDTYGHPAGDEVIKAVGQYLRSCTRGDDAAARVGGEEFLLVLRNADDRAVEIAERVLDGWRETRPMTTMSAGLSIHRSGHSSDETYAAADAALYLAKQSGRDNLKADPDSVVVTADG